MKVLLVDDESYMTEYLKKLVDWKSYGFEEVLTASGGSIARDLIEQKKPELLVTDIRMPRVSGLDLVKYIDEKNYPTKTIILSGYSEFEYAQQALRYGVTEYLVKPILKKDFQISLEHVMEKFFEKEESFPDDGISAVKKYIADARRQPSTIRSFQPQSVRLFPVCLLIPLHRYHKYIKPLMQPDR